MAKFSLTDVVFASLHLRGNSVATLRLSGVSSFNEILARLLKAAPAALRGIATVEIRNGSQGWAEKRNIMLARA